MTLIPPGAGAEPPARILVVDDDHRVLELLAVALGGRGYEVITAADGEEAIRQTLGQRPDLVVLDVRLPRRGGFEVCELLRRDRELSAIPIVMVSAAAEPEVRLQAFARGADDYLTKPFSPRELLARIQRLLARARDAGEMRRRSHDLERELHRAQDESRRARATLGRELRLREIAFDVGAAFHRALDPDAVAAGLLAAARDRLGLPAPAVLLPDPSGEWLVPLHGPAPGVALPRGGEIARLVAGLRRPVSRAWLERIPETADEIPALIAARALLVAAVPGPDGLEALLLAEGESGAEAGADLVPGLCEVAGLALANARRVRAAIEAALAALADGAAGEASEWRAAAVLRVDAAAAAAGLGAGWRHAVGHAVGIGRWGAGPAGRRALKRIAADDPTALTRRVDALLAHLERLPVPGEAAGLELERASALVAAGVALTDALAAGLAGGDAGAAARAAAGEALDPAAARVLAEGEAGAQRPVVSRLSPCMSTRGAARADSGTG